MTEMIDLSQLPPPDCVKSVSFAGELELLLDAYTLEMRKRLDDDTFPRPLVSDPAYQILSTTAYRLGIQRQQINEACQATMLAYARGADLDQIGANFDVSRLLISLPDESINPPTPAVYESDERFRHRIQMAMEAWTTAGSRGSYEFFALTASARVLDVFIDRPEFDRTDTTAAADDSGALDSYRLNTLYDARLTYPMPGDVAVTLLIDSNVAQADIWEMVKIALDTEERIPLTDTPRLLEAEIIHYSVTAVLYCYPGPSTAPIIEEANAQLESYVTEHYRLGHDIAVSGLHQAAHRGGVQRVELTITLADGTTTRDDITIEPHQAAFCDLITVSLGGRDV